MSGLSFDVKEILALLGLAQCLYILVFMGIRSNRLTRATLPSLFFATLGAAFFLTAAESRWIDGLDHYGEMKWFLWTFIYPLSTLLVLQIASVTKSPSFSLWGMFFLIPIAYLIALVFGYAYGEMDIWLRVSGVVVGAISLLLIWTERQFLDELYIRKNGRERYWLIISLIVLNIALLAVNFISINYLNQIDSYEMALNIIGLSFVYVASTSLFRIYPQAISIAPETTKEKADYLSDDEINIAMKIENLLHVDKVYQEPNYKRSDLAREVLVTDSHLSKIVNIYFEKSVPQLLNTYRVEDAKYLLNETDADIAVISEEAGFNSIATFNRVFKEMVGVNPSEYREKKH